MRIKLGELKSIVREEYLRGVPEFQLTEATHKFVGEIGQLVKRHIQTTRPSETQAREALVKAEEVLAELEEETNALVEEKVWKLTEGY